MEHKNESVLAGLGRLRAQWIANLRDQVMAHKHETHMTVSPLQLAVLFRALDAAHADGVKEGIEMARSVAMLRYERATQDRDRAAAVLAYTDAARLHTLAQGMAVVLASIGTLSPPPAEPSHITCSACGYAWVKVPDET